MLSGNFSPAEPQTPWSGATPLPLALVQTLGLLCLQDWRALLEESRVAQGSADEDQRFHTPQGIPRPLPPSREQHRSAAECPEEDENVGTLPATVLCTLE